MRVPFLMILLGIFASSSLFAKDPHPDTLRVMSYNTWYVFAKGKEQEAGMKFVQSQTPDVVGLQELTNIQPGKLSQLAEGWSHPHSCLLKTRGFSVGLTSRWPIQVVEKRVKGMHHGYLHAVTGDVHYFVIHLSPFRWEVRLKESKMLLEKIAPLLKEKKRVIVLGDFNALSPADKKWHLANKELLPRMIQSDQKHGHVQNLRNEQFDYSVMENFLSSELVDTAAGHLPNDAAHRTSFPTGIFKDKKTAPEKGQRIDYILAGPTLAKQVSSCTIIRNGVVNKTSDHYPVVTDFNIKR